MADKFIEKITKLDCAGSEENIGDVYIVLPNNFDIRAVYPLMIALHGSGREAYSYKNIPFYMKQRDMAIDSGYIFASISNGTNTFGTDDGFNNFLKLFEYIKANYNINDSISLFASSAGGLLMHRIFRSMPKKVGLMMGVFPLFDPIVMPPIRSLLNAYNAIDINDFMPKVKFLDPRNYPMNIYKNTQIIISHGIDDVLVPITQSEKLLDQITEFGGKMDLHISSGGHSIDNFDIYNTELFHEALINQKKLLDK